MLSSVTKAWSEEEGGAKTWRTTSLKIIGMLWVSVHVPPRKRTLKSIQPTTSDFAWNLPDNTCMSFVECIEETPEPTPAPSAGEIESLTPQPTPEPTTPAPYATVSSSIELLKSKRELIENQVLVSMRLGIPSPSKRYKFDRLVRALQIIAIDGFGAPFKVRPDTIPIQMQLPRM